MSPQPVTVDGHEIPPEAPPGMGQTPADVQALSVRAEDYRQVIPHCHFDLTGRELTAYAANFPDGPVLFNFGDGTSEVTEQSANAQATATHTYERDGVFQVAVRNWSKRWATEVAINWPPPPPADPIPTLTSIDPVTGETDAVIALRVDGTDFRADSVVQFDAVDVETVVTSPVQLTCELDLTGVPADVYPVLVRTGAHFTGNRAFTVTSAPLEE